MILYILFYVEKIREEASFCEGCGKKIKSKEEIRKNIEEEVKKGNTEESQRYQRQAQRALDNIDLLTEAADNSGREAGRRSCRQTEFLFRVILRGE